MPGRSAGEAAALKACQPSALEGACAHWRHALVNAHEAWAREAPSGDPDAYYYANERLHEIVYGASHNSYLAEQAR